MNKTGLWYTEKKQLTLNIQKVQTTQKLDKHLQNKDLS